MSKNKIIFFLPNLVRGERGFKVGPLPPRQAREGSNMKMELNKY